MCKIPLILITTTNQLNNEANILIAISSKGCTNVQCTHEKMLHIISYYENSNPNHNEILSNNN